MDYLDPKQQRANTIRLLVGYLLVGVAVLIATLILLYQAYGFGFGKHGEVVQKGLVFMSSQPSSAKLYLNSKLYKSTTNTKLQLESGQYKVELQRKNYRSWERIVTVEGGSVQHFDYPKLFPTDMKSTAVKVYPEAPGFATQSPDRRWIVAQQGTAPLAFDLFDVADHKKVTTTATSFSLPDGVVTTARTAAHGYKLVEWSTDNRHILVLHSYVLDGVTPSSEYVMIDRQAPASSVNLTKTLALTPTKLLTLRDKKFDKYYVYDSTERTLGTTSVGDVGKITPLLADVLAYKSYGSDIVLYVTDKDSTTGLAAPAGKVFSRLLDGGQTYKLREHSATGPFLIDLAQYSGDWYVAVGATSDNKVYVYQNPQHSRKVSPTSALVPIWVLRVNAPTHLAFSSNTEFIMIEGGTGFADYDAETGKGYSYVSKLPLDAPALHADWMDGNRLNYVSGGKLTVFDYDNINVQSLVSASPNYTPFYDRDYAYVYTMSPSVAANGTASVTLNVSSLLTPADQ